MCGASAAACYAPATFGWSDTCGASLGTTTPFPAFPRNLASSSDMQLLDMSRAKQVGVGVGVGVGGGTVQFSGRFKAGAPKAH